MQHSYSVIDLMIVGNFSGVESMAGIGATASIINMLLGLALGLSTGCSVVVSQANGAHDYDKLYRAVHTSYALALVSGIVISLIGVFLAPHMLMWMGTPAEIAPVLEPFEIGSGLAEKFKLHLLEFTRPEDKVSRRNLVAESFADLPDTKGNLSTRCTLNITIVNKNTLCRLRAQVDFRETVFRDALVRLEHQIELAHVSKVIRSALRTWNSILMDITVKRFILPSVNIKLDTLRDIPLVDQLIGARTSSALSAIDHRIGKPGDVSRCDPYLRVHQDRSVDPDIERTRLDEATPPSRF
jgi:hypothetical protein